MRNFLFLFVAFIAFTVRGYSTDITIASFTQQGFNPSGLPAVQTKTGVSVTNGSTAVTCSSCLNAQWVGSPGFTIGINGVLYEVASVNSSSSLTLRLVYAGASSVSATITWYSYAFIQIYSNISFRPLGASYVVQAGTPGSSAWFRRFAASVINSGSVSTLYWPQITIPATTDSADNNTARYTFGIYAPSGAPVNPNQPFYLCSPSNAQLRIPPVTPNSMADICTFNSNTTIVQDNRSYTIQESNENLPACAVNQITYNAVTGLTRACLNVGTGLSITSGTLNATGGGGSGDVQITDVAFLASTCNPASKTLYRLPDAGLQTLWLCAATPGMYVRLDNTGATGGGSGSAGMTDPGSNGVVARTALNTTTSRSVAGVANETSVTNGDGVSGNPTVGIASTLDLSGKTSTKPIKTGTTVPATCAVGEYFFDTDATAGQNTYACTSTNTWTLQGSAAASAYSTIQNDSISLTQRNTFNFDTEYLTGADNSGAARTDIRLKRTPNGVFNAVSEYNCSPDPSTTTGSISAGSLNLTVGSSLGYKVGQGILIAGSGVSGTDLVTTVSAVPSGTTITVGTVASTTVSGARVQHDNTNCLQNAITAKGAIHLPAGNYLVTSPITLPTATEGNSFAVQGNSVSSTTIHYQGLGSLFVGNDSAMEAITFRDISIATSTPGSYSDVRPTVSRGSAFDFSKTSVVNYARWENMRIIGWGRWGIFVGNCQGCTVSKVVFRQNAQGHLGLVGPETVLQTGSSEPNVNLIIGNQYDLMPNIAGSDLGLVALSILNNSYILTASSSVFTSAHEGRLIRVVGAGVSSGDLVGIIKSVDSGTQATLSCKNQTGGNLAGLTGTIYKPNFASVYIQRGQKNSFVSNVIQGNCSDCATEVDAVRLENAVGNSFNGHWVEDTGGSAGHDFRIINSAAITINSYHSNASPASATDDCHAGNLKVTGSSRNIVVSGMDNLNPTKHFDIETGSEVQVDNSYLSAPENVQNQFQSGSRDDALIVGENVQYYTEISTGKSLRGTARLRDAEYGEQWLINPRFDDNMTGWTDTNPTFHARTTGTGRYGTYQLIDTSALADAGEATVFEQVVNIPDIYPQAQGWVLGFDYYITSFGTTPTSGRQVRIRVIPSASGVGYEGSGTFEIDSPNDSFQELNKWKRMQYVLYPSSGTSRTWTIRVLSTQGPNTPRVRLTNFRLQPGKHAAFSHDQPITEQGAGADGNLIRANPGLLFKGAPLASLGTPAAGAEQFCTDCARGSDPCTGSSTGAKAFRANGRWYCP